MKKSLFYRLFLAPSAAGSFVKSGEIFLSEDMPLMIFSQNRTKNSGPGMGFEVKNKGQIADMPPSFYVMDDNTHLFEIKKKTPPPN